MFLDSERKPENLEGTHMETLHRESLGLGIEPGTPEQNSACFIKYNNIDNNIISPFLTAVYSN